MATVLSIELITSDPKVRGGQPCIAGTGVRVSDVAAVMLYHHLSPDEVAAWFAVGLAEVYAALAYYYAHKSQIDADIRQQIQAARDMKEKGVGRRDDSILS